MNLKRILFPLVLWISLSNPVFAGPGDIAINEIMFKPRVQQFYNLLDALKGQPWWETGDHPQAEYIELVNTGDTEVDLSGWSFAEGITFELPAETVLQPGEYLAICADAEIVKAEYGIENAIGDTVGVLSNNGERITLVDASDPPVVIDSVRYLDAPPWPLSPDQEGRSLECMDPTEDNSRPENWRASRRLEVVLADTPEFPVHGDRRRLLGGTPGAANTVETFDGLPPFATNVTHEPLRPSSIDTVTVSAEVTADAAIADVVLHYEFYREPFPYDGPVQSGTLGMTRREGRIYEVQIAPQPSRTLVRYRVEVLDVEGRSWVYPDEVALSKHRAYWSYDGEQDGTIPTYFLIFSRIEFDRLESDPFAKDPVDATFIADGTVFDHIKTRYRGCRGCSKRSYKVKFNRHEHLREMNRLDLNADWPVAEKIGYDMFWFMGEENLGTELVRLVRNGSFAGILLALDSPNGFWAERRGMSGDIELYKAREGGTLLGVPGTFSPSLTYYPDHLFVYPQIYIKRGDSLGSFQTLIDFTRNLSTLTGRTAGPYLNQNVQTDSWMRKVTVQLANAYCDFHVKNYYAFRTPDPEGIWGVLFYDIDGYWAQTMAGRLCNGCERTNPFCSGNSINTLALGNPEIRNRLAYAIREATLNILTDDRILEHVDKLYDLTSEDRAVENSTLQGPLVATDPRVEDMKAFFSARREYLMSFIANFPIADPANGVPSIRLADPLTFDDAPGAPVLIEWEYEDAEGDPALVDLYWTDLAWSYLQPIVSSWPAHERRYGWNENVPVTDKDIYIHAVIRDGNSDFVSRGTEGPVSLFTDTASDEFIPAASPAGGEFSGGQDVTLDALTGAQIYYTMDGTDPRVSSTRVLYSGPFQIASSVVVRSAAIVKGSETLWRVGDDWSDTDNPSGAWTYADADGNPITDRQADWMELGPAWASAPDGGSGWARSEDTLVEPDLPRHTVFTLGDSTLRWTSPVSGEILIDGGFWLTLDRRRKMNWELTHNGEVFTARSDVSRVLGISTRPYLFDYGDGGQDALRRTVEIGDVIEFSLWTDRDLETTAVDLQIAMRTEDLVSPVSEASFTSTGGGLETLRITEIMYNGDATPDFDFLEIQNTGNSVLDLFGVSFASGITFQFGSARTLEPGAFAVLVANSGVFEARYPGVRIDGTFLGTLDNGGERLALVDRHGDEILRIDYDDAGLWPVAADGFGHSLVLRDPARDGRLAEHWRASANPQGSPGARDPVPEHDGVWIHEVLTRGGEVTENAIELFNATTRPINVGGWFLSDDRSNVSTLMKYEIPGGTVIEPRAFATFYEYQFNATPGGANSFALAASGGGVYLSASNAAGDLTGTIIGHEFASSDGRTIGLHRTSNGLQSTTLSAMSLGVDEPTDLVDFRRGSGAPNALPDVGPVVFHEIRYDPDDTQGEFVELRNLTNTPIALHDQALDSGWRVDGLRSVGGAGDYEFPSGAQIDAEGFALLVDMDPNLFRARHNVAANVPIFGPFGGRLDDAGESLRLLRPLDTPDVFDVSFSHADVLDFDVGGVWPTVRPGASLERVRRDLYGNEPLNWAESALLDGTPGRANSAEQPDDNLAPIARFEFRPENDSAIVTLDALTSTDLDGRIVSHEWEIGEDVVASGQWIERTLPFGETEVTLSVTDDDGATSQSTQHIVVSSSGSDRPGDANSDGSLNLSDAIKLLLLLFDPNGRSIPCGGATVSDGGNVVLLDFDGSEGLDTNDVLGLLRYLFLAGPAHARGTRCIEVPGCAGACESSL